MRIIPDLKNPNEVETVKQFVGTTIYEQQKNSRKEQNTKNIFNFE